jgi:hypothetical protein
MRRAATLLLGLILLAACGDDSPETGETQDLATLKSITAPYTSFDAGKAAGWSAPFMNACFASDSGAMGVHYGNGTIDLAATPSVTKPPFLMYEPRQDGSMKLVGVEYVKAAPETDPAPVLFNQRFGFNGTLKVWTLHVWAWKTNPAGLYASWKPTVTCQFTPAQLSTMAHH